MGSLHAGETFPNEIYRFVDVRDVASAHIQAFEQASANGRYCLVGRVVHFSEFLKIVHEQYPALQLPEKYFFFLVLLAYSLALYFILI